MTRARLHSRRRRRARRRRRRGRRRDRERRRAARHRRSRSSAPARAGSTGWSRWSRSRPPPGRIAYGPVDARRCRRACSTPAARRRGAHPLRLGLADEIPWLKRQTRLTFARCGIIDPLSLDDYRAHGGYQGLERALALAPAAIVEEVDAVRPARPRRRRLPDRHQVADGRADAGAAEIHRLQRRRGRQRHLRRPHDHGGRSVRADRGHDDRRHRGRRDQGLRLHPLRISARHRRDGGGDRRGAARRHARPAVADSGSRLRHRGARRRRRLCLRRGDLAARKPRGQARHRARQAAAAGAQGPVRPADRHQQRAVACRPCRSSSSEGAASTATSAWAARAAPCRSSSPATSGMAACSRPPSASRSASSSTTSAAAPRAAGRCARCRSAARSAPISRARCSTRRSTTRPSPPATG